MNTGEQAGLKRTLGFWALTAYGVGDILGAGIYALVGKIAGIAGTASWAAFGVALAVAAWTALSYCELGSRYPRSGGESFFVQQAFGRPSPALLVGWFVLCSGVVSMATVSLAFSGYLLGPNAESAEWLRRLLAVLFVIGLAGINFWGIRQSSVANIVCTVVEASGLLIVLVVGAAFLWQGAAEPVAAEPVAAEPGAGTGGLWLAVARGGALAFFAFIGFEDMVNVAEEVKSPERTLPAAILTALFVAGGIYLLVVWVSTRVVDGARLGASEAPLLEVVQVAAPRFPQWIFTPIALFAVTNTALLNCVMGSRLLYGMSTQGLMPGWLNAVHPRTGTPHRSIVAVGVVAATLAVTGTLVDLAGTTSALLLLVFATVNAGLVVIRKTQGRSPGAFNVPLAVPIVGGLSALALIAFTPAKSLFAAAAIVATGLVLVAVRWVRSTGEG